MRRAARVDANQKDIVKALRSVGCTVLDLSSVGSGCPDLLVARGGLMWLMEVKDGSKPPSERRLTSDQVLFHKFWPVRIHIVENEEQAIGVVT